MTLFELTVPNRKVLQVISDDLFPTTHTKCYNKIGKGNSCLYFKLERDKIKDELIFRFSLLGKNDFKILESKSDLHLIQNLVGLRD